MDHVLTKRGITIPVAVNEELTILDTADLTLLPEKENYDQEKLRKGLDAEMAAMHAHDVYEPVLRESLTYEEQQNIIKTRWLLKEKGDDVKARLIVQDYERQVPDRDDIYASTPGMTTVKLLLTHALQRNWDIVLGDITTAFLHASLDKNYHVLPPKEYYPEKVTWYGNYEKHYMV